jgi:hypothetical protein
MCELQGLNERHFLLGRVWKEDKTEEENEENEGGMLNFAGDGGPSEGSRLLHSLHFP